MGVGSKLLRGGSSLVLDDVYSGVLGGHVA